MNEVRKLIAAFAQDTKSERALKSEVDCNSLRFNDRSYSTYMNDVASNERNRAGGGQAEREIDEPS